MLPNSDMDKDEDRGAGGSPRTVNVPEIPDVESYSYSSSSASGSDEGLDDNRGTNMFYPLVVTTTGEQFEYALDESVPSRHSARQQERENVVDINNICKESEESESDGDADNVFIVNEMNPEDADQREVYNPYEVEESSGDDYSTDSNSSEGEKKVERTKPKNGTPSSLFKSRTGSDDDEGELHSFSSSRNSENSCKAKEDYLYLESLREYVRNRSSSRNAISLSLSNSYMSEPKFEPFSPLAIRKCIVEINREMTTHLNNMARAEGTERSDNFDNHSSNDYDSFPAHYGESPATQKFMVIRPEQNEIDILEITKRITQEAVAFITDKFTTFEENKLAITRVMELVNSILSNCVDFEVSTAKREVIVNSSSDEAESEDPHMNIKTPDLQSHSFLARSQRKTLTKEIIDIYHESGISHALASFSLLKQNEEYSLLHCILLANVALYEKLDVMLDTSYLKEIFLVSRMFPLAVQREGEEAKASLDQDNSEEEEECVGIVLEDASCLIETMYEYIKEYYPPDLDKNTVFKSHSSATQLVKSLIALILCASNHTIYEPNKTELSSFSLGTDYDMFKEPDVDSERQEEMRFNRELFTRMAEFIKHDKDIEDPNYPYQPSTYSIGSISQLCDPKFSLNFIDPIVRVSQDYFTTDIININDEEDVDDLEQVSADEEQIRYFGSDKGQNSSESTEEEKGELKMDYDLLNQTHKRIQSGDGSEGLETHTEEVPKFHDMASPEPVYNNVESSSEEDGDIDPAEIEKNLTNFIKGSHQLISPRSSTDECAGSTSDNEAEAQEPQGFMDNAGLIS